MSKVSRHIKTLRQARGLSQETLAEQLFVTRQTVSNWETGRSQPDIDTLLHIAQTLGSDLNALIYGPPPKPNRKRDLVKLGISGGILLILALALYFFMPYASKQASQCYKISWLMLGGMLGLPLLCFLVGWTLMQGLSTVGLLCQPAPRPWFAAAFWSLVGLLLLYLLLLLPHLSIMLSADILPYQDGFSPNTTLPRDPFFGSAFYGKIIMNMYFVFGDNPAFFVLPGFLLWFFQPPHKAAKKTT